MPKSPEERVYPQSTGADTKDGPIPPISEKELLKVVTFYIPANLDRIESNTRLPTRMLIDRMDSGRHPRRVGACWANGNCIAIYAQQKRIRPSFDASIPIPGQIVARSKLDFLSIGTDKCRLLRIEDRGHQIAVVNFVQRAFKRGPCQPFGKLLGHDNIRRINWQRHLLVPLPEAFRARSLKSLRYADQAVVPLGCHRRAPSMTLAFSSSALRLAHRADSSSSGPKKVATTSLDSSSKTIQQLPPVGAMAA